MSQNNDHQHDQLKGKALRHQRTAHDCCVTAGILYFVGIISLIASWYLGPKEEFADETLIINPQTLENVNNFLFAYCEIRTPIALGRWIPEYIWNNKTVAIHIEKSMFDYWKRHIHATKNKLTMKTYESVLQSLDSWMSFSSDHFAHHQSNYLRLCSSGTVFYNNQQYRYINSVKATLFLTNCYVYGLRLFMEHELIDSSIEKNIIQKFNARKKLKLARVISRDRFANRNSITTVNEDALTLVFNDTKIFDPIFIRQPPHSMDIQQLRATTHTIFQDVSDIDAIFASEILQKWMENNVTSYHYWNQFSLQQQRDVVNSIEVSLNGSKYLNAGFRILPFSIVVGEANQFAGKSTMFTEKIVKWHQNAIDHHCSGSDKTIKNVFWCEQVLKTFVMGSRMNSPFLTNVHVSNKTKQQPVYRNVSIKLQAEFNQ